MARRGSSTSSSPATALLARPSPRAAPCSPRCVAIRLESRGGAFYRQRRVGQGRARVRRPQAAHDGHRRRARWARASRSTRATRGSPASARCCGARRSTSCPTSSTSCAARWRSSARGRPCRSRSTQYTDAPARAPRGQPGHHRLGAGQRARRAAVGRAHRARPLVHRAPLVAPRPADPVAHGAHGVRRRGPVPRRDARLARPAGLAAAVTVLGAAAPSGATGAASATALLRIDASPRGTAALGEAATAGGAFALGEVAAGVGAAAGAAACVRSDRAWRSGRA